MRGREVGREGEVDTGWEGEFDTGREEVQVVDHNEHWTEEEEAAAPAGRRTESQLPALDVPAQL